MKKHFIVSIIAISLMTLPMNAFAASNDTSAEGLNDAKLEAHDQLVEDGTIDNQNEKMAQYYAEYGDQLITSQDFAEASSAERTELIKELEASELDFIESTSDTAENNLLTTSENVVSTKAASSDHGLNDMDWDNFQNGDIVLVHDGSCVYGYYRHSGTYYTTKKKCISAQIKDQGNGQGVIYEPKSWYNSQYDEAVGYSVNDATDDSRSAVMKYLKAQIGKPYAVASYYKDETQWNCIKLPWAGWLRKASINIGVDVLIGGNLNKADGIPFPDSIAWSPEVTQFASGS